MTGEARRNRLADESSPYLLQHRGNPVDWYPWGEEALARARREDKPIFLSVGYSTCHWCHVMARESFSDPATAALMNAEFVNIKVDREERPDIDEIYMTATQILGGQGGWPMSVFLTPALEPFFAGTYFPPEDRWGLPGFATVLRSLARAWRERRADVETQAREAAAAVRRFLDGGVEPAAGVAGAEAARRAVDALGRRFDPVWGGFGGAPKFPSPASLWLLAETAEQDERAAEMLAVTLDRMARGGLHDQLAGGFHRYATDHEWRVPHFEKMLYDNALLLELYAGQWRRTGDPETARVARDTAAFLGSEMTAPDGSLWSAIDAESEGREGAYYVWSGEELRAALGDGDFAFLAPLYGFDVAPSFEGGRHVLHLPAPLAEQAARRRTTREALLAEIEPLRRRLLAARFRRPRPATDDKVLADWNGMAIGALATAGRLLAEPRLVARAVAAAERVLRVLWPAGGPLRHSARDGRLGPPAFLADYAWLVRGLLALGEPTGDERWLEAAVALAEEQGRRLAAADGTFYSVAVADDLLARGREAFDGAVPAAGAVTILDDLELWRRTGDRRWAERAERGLAALGGLVGAAGGGAQTLAVALLRWHALGLGAGSGLAAEAARAVAVELAVEPATPAGDIPFALRLRIAPGWHLTGAGADGLGLAVDEGEFVGLELPPAAPSPAGDTGPAGYRGELTVRGRVRPTGGVAPRLRLSLQACDARRCLPPTIREFALGSG